MTGKSSGESWRDIATYSDGSGLAGDFYDNALEKIAKRRAVLDLNSKFVEDHKETLAGLNWSVGYLDPEIEVRPGNYRGAHAGPAEIAKLWGCITWKRKLQKYGDGLTYDWRAELDGVTIVIKAAEREKPSPRRLRQGVVRIHDGGAV